MCCSKVVNEFWTVWMGMDVQLQTCIHQILIIEYFLFGFAHLGRWHLESCQVWCFAFSFTFFFSLAPSLFRNVTEEISGWSQFGNHGHPECDFGPLEQIQRLWPPDFFGMPRSSKMELEDSPKCFMDVENSRYDISIPSCSSKWCFTIAKGERGTLQDFSKLQDQSLSILWHWLVWQMRSSSSNNPCPVQGAQKKTRFIFGCHEESFCWREIGNRFCFISHAFGNSGASLPRACNSSIPGTKDSSPLELARIAKFFQWCFGSFSFSCFQENFAEAGQQPW